MVEIATGRLRLRRFRPDDLPHDQSGTVVLDGRREELLAEQAAVEFGKLGHGCT